MSLFEFDSNSSAAIAEVQGESLSSPPPWTHASHRKPFILTSDPNTPTPCGTTTPAKAMAVQTTLFHSTPSQAQGTKFHKDFAE